MKRILTGDIGGTNSRFGWFGEEGGRLVLIKSLWLKTGEYPSFEALMEALTSTAEASGDVDADLMVLAAAGPVEQGVRCFPPNAPWSIDLTHARQDFGLPDVLLINDFAAQAYACTSPVAEKALSILPGVSDPDSVLAVMGAGTGLGMAALLPVAPSEYAVVSSEGGHAGFPFEREEEFRFERFYRPRSGAPYLTGDLVLSGRGLTAVHHFHTGEELPPEEVAERLTADSETLVWAARFFGRACRNYALQVLARQGLYIAGGLAAKNPLLVRHRAFQEEFLLSQTMHRVLARIPVFLNPDEESGLWGAAVFGRRILSKGFRTGASP